MPAYDNKDGRLRGRKLQAARLRIWQANPHCARCGKLVAYPSGFELDHKQAITKDGSNDDDNLQVLCIERDQSGNKSGCHVEKTAEDLGYAMRKTIGADGWPVKGWGSAGVRGDSTGNRPVPFSFINVDKKS